MKIKGKFRLAVRAEAMYTCFSLLHSGIYQTKKPVAIQSF